MIRSAWLGFTFITLGLLFILQTADAQVVDYGKSLPKDPAATEDYGIVAYNLSSEGDVYFIELLGAEGTLASCRVVINEVQEATCDVTDKGHFRSRIGKKVAEFEDLNTGEYTRVHFERVFDPDESGLEELGPDETLEVGRTAIVQGFKMRVESPLDAEEIERRWGEISRLMGHAIAEVALTFGMVEEMIEEQVKDYRELRDRELEKRGLKDRELEDQEPRDRELRDKEELKNSEHLELCPEGQRQVCIVGAIGGYYANAFATTQGICCSVASGLADNLCFQTTQRGCCANTICVTRGFAPFVRCDLDGIPWTCSYC